MQSVCYTEGVLIMASEVNPQLEWSQFPFEIGEFKLSADAWCDGAAYCNRIIPGDPRSAILRRLDRTTEMPFDVFRKTVCYSDGVLILASEIKHWK